MEGYTIDPSLRKPTSFGSSHSLSRSHWLAQVAKLMENHQQITGFHEKFGERSPTMANGASPALPTAEQVETFLNSQPRETPRVFSSLK
jgi:hypothetical protein